MEWTDGKLEERLDRIDERFDEVNRRISDSKAEASRRFDRIEGDVREVKKGLAEVQATLNRGWIGLALGFLTLFGAIIAKGG